MPTATATMYLREAFDRTAARERRWPSYQQDWAYVVPAEDGNVTYDSTIAEIMSVYNSDTGQRLTFVDHDQIREIIGMAPAKFFSLWGGKLWLWGAPDGDVNIEINGYRKPTYTWLSDPAREVDLDERLHSAIFHYAVSLTYAQQEDPELEQMYMRRWAAILGEVTGNVIRGQGYRPLVLNGGLNQSF